MLKSLQEAESLHYSKLELHPYADDVLESDHSDFAAFARDIAEEEPVAAQWQLQLWLLVFLLWWSNIVGGLEPIPPSSSRSNM